jgi:hypothetical protein
MRHSFSIGWPDALEFTSKAQLGERFYGLVSGQGLNVEKQQVQVNPDTTLGRFG